MSREQLSEAEEAELQDLALATAAGLFEPQTDVFRQPNCGANIETSLCCDLELLLEPEVTG
jgi:hypothetical protein